MAALAVAAAGPYIFLSPGYLREDFDSLANAVDHGAFGAAGSRVALARPGSALVFSLVFGPLGGRPAIAIGLMVFVHALNAALLYAIAGKMLPRTTALAVGGVWAVLPINSALTHWASAAHIGLALTLVLLAVLLLWRAHDSTLAAVGAVALVVMAGLTYEAVLPFAVAAGLLVPKLATGRHRPWLSATMVAAVGLVGLWHLSTTTKDEFVLLAPDNVVHGHFGSELIKIPGVAQLAVVGMLLALCLSVSRLVLPSFRSGPGERLVVAGMGVILLGTAPFLAYGWEIDYVMQGDRGTVVSGIGVAFVLVGTACLLAGRRWLVWLVGAGLAAGFAVTQATNHLGYSRSSRQLQNMLAAAKAQVGPSEQSLVVVANLPLGCAGVETMNADIYLRFAAQWFLRRDFETVKLLDADDVNAPLPGSLDATRLAATCGSLKSNGARHGSRAQGDGCSQRSGCVVLLGNTQD